MVANFCGCRGKRERRIQCCILKQLVCLTQLFTIYMWVFFLIGDPLFLSLQFIISFCKTIILAFFYRVCSCPLDLQKIFYRVSLEYISIRLFRISLIIYFSKMYSFSYFQLFEQDRGDYHALHVQQITSLQIFTLLLIAILFEKIASDSSL